LKLKKFYADTPREALRLVRAQLGESALILSNRRTGAGVEIVAVAAEEMQAMTAAVAPPRRQGPSSAGRIPGAGVPPRSDAPIASAGRNGERGAPAHAPATVSRGPADQRSLSRAAGMVGNAYNRSAPEAPAAMGGAAAGRSGTLPAAQADPSLLPAGSFDLVHEVRVLRSLVEGQLAAIAWADLKRRDPACLEVVRRLLQAGFGMKLSRQLADELPDGLDLGRALRLTKARLQRLIPLPVPPGGLVERGGVYALVGPTGVGKTTTVAKVAAECALRFGPDQLALVTTDTYRIGAVDQLRIYGRILNVPVLAIRDEAELRRTLSDLRTRRLVLIDTVGMSQRDRRLADQIGLLSGAGRPVQRVLLLSAVAQTGVLDDVIHAYRGEALLGCILTKVDEAPSLGTALDVLVRHRLTLHYVTNGQRVPEDLHRPNPLYLVERAFRGTSDAAAPGSDPDVSGDAELLMAAARA
jgi:flagellar biosynthesis protein FlhF